MQYKVNSKLLIVNASDQSGVLVYVCFSMQVLHMHTKLQCALEKLSVLKNVTKVEVDSWLGTLDTHEQEAFWESLLSNFVLVPSSDIEN